MNRRELLQRTTMFSLVSAIPFSSAVADRTRLENARSLTNAGLDVPAVELNPLKPPAHGSIPVAFVISEGAVVIDFCGPWESLRECHVVLGIPHSRDTKCPGSCRASRVWLLPHGPAFRRAQRSKSHKSVRRADYWRMTG
jgi:hypothetical protein